MIDVEKAIQNEISEIIDNSTGSSLISRFGARAF